MATDQDQEGSNKAYLREQQIPLLFDQLLRGLLQRKPDDSLSYLHRTIAELRTSQTHTNKAMNELLLSRVDKRNPEECAALVLQSAYRKWLRKRDKSNRRRHERQLESIIVIQAVGRRFLANKRVRTIKTAADTNGAPPAAAAGS